MDISWGDLGTAIALMLVIEGVMPFLNPKTFCQTLAMVSQMQVRNVRVLGLLWMGSGIGLLYWIRG